MPVNFPDIKPTSRRFTPPAWPLSDSTSRSGLRSYRLWGSRPSNAVLDLGFGNITDTNTVAILDAYYAAKGPLTDLTLPSVIFQGASTNLANWMKLIPTGSGILWYFSADGPPQVDSVAPNTSNVQVRLTAELRLISA